MDPITIALIAIGGMAIAGGTRPKKGLRPPEDMSLADRMAMLGEVRNMSSFYSNTFQSMPGLSDYLTVIGFRESNFNPNAINSEVKTNANAARGLFGLRPESILKKSNGLERLLATPNVLLNPRWSFVCSVFHIWDACNRLNNTGFIPNYSAIRRWWGIPKYIYDYDLESEYSRDNFNRFQKAIDDCNRIYNTDIDPDFIFEPILGWENYPGMSIMLQSFGLD